MLHIHMICAYYAKLLEFIDFHACISHVRQVYSLLIQIIEALH